MNEFLDQFLVESRELIAQATDDLLALEEQPGARDRLDGVFRGFHTLKGAAGIMEFDAMARALHAAEDVLSAARAGAEAVTPALISDCLTCLDQVLQWLDVMEAHGELPADADAAADAVARRFVRAPVVTLVTAAEPRAADGDWSAALRGRHPEAGDRARLALRYTPAPDCFFLGGDPLSQLEGLPGLLALEMAPAEAFGPLAAFDPFRCQVVLQALFAEGAPQTLQALEGLGAGAEVIHLAGAAGPPHGLSALEAALLDAQVLMLRVSGDADGRPGRIAAAARVASQVLRVAGRPAAADRVAQIAATSGADSLVLINALEQVLAGEDAPAASADPVSQGLATEPATRQLRVDLDRVDALVSLTGEMTVAKNALAHAAALAHGGGDPKVLAELLKAQLAQLDRLVAELQRAVLNLRVLPMRHVFQRFPRLIREMVVALDRPARLVTEGDDTEADKAVVENLFEPLLHVLRNALDHGVETAAERAAAGKPPSATITLRARRDGDRVVVEVADDGRGIDVDRIRDIAAKRGLASPEALEALSDDQVRDLIFAPGFSTAEAVTGFSGRGVGMDAVRSALARLGGRVDVESRPGEGALVRFALPFTVVMSRVMTVEVGGQMFGVPMEAIVETISVPRDRIVAVAGGRAFVLRDRTVPMIDLVEALGRTPGPGVDGPAKVVVAALGGQVGAFEVDRLGDRLDVMLKPLDGLLSGTPGVAGTTLLGDGRVLLVLDLQALMS